MFTRELPLVSALRLWDGLFAMRNQMDNLIESVCVAMLMRIRHLSMSLRTRSSVINLTLYAQSYQRTMAQS